MVQLTRESVDYKNLSERFIITENDQQDNCFHRQYYKSYRARIRLMRPRIIAAAKQQLGEHMEPCRLTQASKTDSSFVIGVVAKRVKLRPSVLRDLADEQLILPEPVDENTLVSEKDYLEFEDEDQIVRLSGDIGVDDVATGCVIGLIGRQLKDDIFRVDRIIWPKMAVQPPFPEIESDKYVMFVSGLSFSQEPEKEADRLFALDILQKWLSGLLPLSEKAREFTTAARYLVKNEECPNVACAANMDKFLSKVSNMIEVDVMPGLGDPATHLLPQQPIHRAVFPHASYHGKMLNLVTNPYNFSVEGVNFLGSSGCPLSDLKRFTVNATSIDLLERTLLWQHLAPTVPDTVDGFPFEDRDPFIIKEAFPHVLFAANQATAECAVREFDGGRRALLLSIPSFAKTKSALIVNLKNLEVIEQNFSFDESMIC
ncbi:unnamed protein product [Anisakis simplex]|uniref:Probable DNA polymerase delta small subunit (inferred by orthology to a C. elegans protein) n=1 Tax=Anisakis simplex TaxID=6269 RepID=A0A0M3K9H7_ANISI|nr:unnamed protein product [Anisakis simplex]